MTGQQLGAKNPAGAMKSGYEAAGMTVISMGLLGVLVAFYARELSSFFIDDLEVINYTVKFVIIFAVIQPFNGFRICAERSIERCWRYKISPNHNFIRISSCKGAFGLYSL